ncbi:hypothetical protein GN958_ATG17642 [Phytophthora infestans]|uniref:DNA helicase n=1 Tax=Phytophthora infestans TaxID=4787 RepID=A0A8S9TWN8_PHYIN|nr:hypothetical protein GN958_ATG17642 [Phytophthora infestans]
MLILFRPFRDRADFGANFISINAIFERWWSSDAAVKAKAFSNHNSDFYEAHQLHKIAGNHDVHRYEQCSSDENSTLDVCPDPDFDNDTEDGIVCFSKHLVTTTNIFDLTKCKQTTFLASRSGTPALRRLILPYVPISSLREKIGRMETVYNKITLSPHSALRPDPILCPTRVMYDASAEDSPEWEAPADVNNRVELQPNSSLRDTSRHFNLNRKQHKAFVLAGKKLIQSIRNQPGQQPLRAFLGGKPGSGKSAVIHALQALAKSWEYPYAVATVAYQGVAAEAAGGQTIHKMFGWELKQKKAYAAESGAT